MLDTVCYADPRDATARVPVPMVAAPDIETLSRRLVERGNRLRLLSHLGAPEIVVRCERRLIGEALEALCEEETVGELVDHVGLETFLTYFDHIFGTDIYGALTYEPIQTRWT